ncbi:MAG: SPOR domain-containing protein [Tannerella sp.]|jgi:hypothetical protein|nr:SPOR domain-containing protein [Tannerella sp.]
MKWHHCYILICLFLCGSENRLAAQNFIFESLASVGAGKGTVVIHQPAAVRQLVGMLPPDTKIEEENGTRFLLMQGYRVQVFSGNNQRRSKDEAFNKESQIQTLYPDLPTYVHYTAPFWRLRVGDFTSYEEALSTKYKLGDAFPSFKQEINVYREEIRIPLNQF